MMCRCPIATPAAFGAIVSPERLRPEISKALVTILSALQAIMSRAPGPGKHKDCLQSRTLAANPRTEMFPTRGVVRISNEGLRADRERLAGLWSCQRHCEREIPIASVAYQDQTQVPVPFGPSAVTSLHRGNTGDRLHGSNQHTASDAVGLGDDVQAFVDAIDQIDVSVARRSRR